MTPALLVVFAGLASTGKTTLARAVADRLPATFLRIDSIESAIAATLSAFQDNPVGYAMALRVVADQLCAGRSVVADAVNSVAEARLSRVELATEYGARLQSVEVTCSDDAEHRRRVETQQSDLDGIGVPTWAQVQRSRRNPWRQPRLVVDNIDPVEGHLE